MDVMISFLLLIIFLIVLNQASHLTITNAVKVSDVTGLGKTTVGFILIAFSTSLPELSVSVIAAFGGEAALSVGNVIGSNIVNICLIIGLAAVLIGMRRSNSLSVIPPLAKEELGSLYFGLLVASIIPLSLIYLTYASWFVGFILLLVFGAYLYLLSRMKPKGQEVRVSDDMRRKLRLHVVLTFAGVAGVIVSSYFIVDSASAIAEFMGVPKTLIGATIVAFGTSLPEFTIDIKSFLAGHSALALGDIVGSCFINITLILGVTLVAPALVGTPLTVNMVVFSDLVIFSLIANLFLWYFFSTGRLGWKEGAILLFLYVLFLATTLGIIQTRPQP